MQEKPRPDKVHPTALATTIIGAGDATRDDVKAYVNGVAQRIQSSCRELMSGSNVVANGDPSNAASAGSKRSARAACAEDDDCNHQQASKRQCVGRDAAHAAAGAFRPAARAIAGARNRKRARRGATTPLAMPRAAAAAPIATEEDPLEMLFHAWDRAQELGISDERAAAHTGTGTAATAALGSHGFTTSVKEGCQAPEPNDLIASWDMTDDCVALLHLVSTPSRAEVPKADVSAGVAHQILAADSPAGPPSSLVVPSFPKADDNIPFDASMFFA